MKKPIFLLFALLTCLFLVRWTPAHAQAQEAELRLGLTKVFGYLSLGRSEAQGTLRVEARGPEDLVRVMFFIDGQVMGETTEAPFSLSFNSGSYTLGLHTLSATGYSRDGRELSSNEIQVEFVSSERGWQVGMTIVIPLLVIVFGAMLVGTVLPALLGKGKKMELPLGTPRTYGAAGGAICPRCKRPFPLRFLAVNLSPVHKFDRCPFCGKWAVMRRKSSDGLRAAEAVELQQVAEPAWTHAQSAEDKLRKELENSRFQDL